MTNFSYSHKMVENTIDIKKTLLTLNENYCKNKRFAI